MDTEAVLNEIQRVSGVARLRTKHDHIEWSIERTRAAIDPYELPDLLVEFWRSFPEDHFTGALYALGGVSAPFSGLCSEDEEGTENYPHSFLPIGYERHTFIMFELGRDRSEPGTVWKHYFIDGDFEDHGTLPHFLLRCLDDDASARFEPSMRSSARQTWPALWEQRPLAATRFEPPRLRTSEVASTFLRRLWVEGEVTSLPGDEYLIDDGSGPILLRGGNLTAAGGWPVLERLDRRRLGPPLPGQRFKVLIEVIGRPTPLWMHEEQHSFVVGRVAGYNPYEPMDMSNVFDTMFMSIQDEQAEGKTTTDMFAGFDLDISDIHEPEDVMGLFDQMQQQACDRIADSRDQMIEWLLTQPDEVINEYADGVGHDAENLIRERDRRRLAEAKRDADQFEALMRENGFS